MEASFTATQERARAEGADAPATSDEEIEALVTDAIRGARHEAPAWFVSNRSGRRLVEFGKKNRPASAR